jgi:hypothetical protein
LSTLNVPNAPKTYFPVKSIPPPSTSSGESLAPSNQKYKRNKKRKNKKKKRRQREKSPATASHVGDTCHQSLQVKSNWRLEKPTTAIHVGGNTPVTASHTRETKQHAGGKKLQCMLGALILLRNLDEQDTSLSSLVQFAREITLLIYVLLF